MVRHTQILETEVLEMTTEQLKQWIYETRNKWIVKRQTILDLYKGKYKGEFNTVLVCTEVIEMLDNLEEGLREGKE